MCAKAQQLRLVTRRSSVACVFALLCRFACGLSQASIPLWAGWLRFLSIFYYAFSVLVSSEMDGLRMRFELTGFVNVNDLSGRDFTANFNLVPERISRDCISLAALVVLFVALGATTLVAEAGGLRRTRGVPGASRKGR
jgi:hypothetical protein